MKEQKKCSFVKKSNNLDLKINKSKRNFKQMLENSTIRFRYLQKKTKFQKVHQMKLTKKKMKLLVGEKKRTCLLYTSDAADDMQCVDLGGRRIIKKKKKKKQKQQCYLQYKQKIY
eukprot:TRINITY_DN7936_c0_g1_i6.p3 TRINITY_DN7936_c0_g1~~TRINITY_DN7936_c0_g1_i6.p3  ORF type:complete len:115 (+),score=34.84 TRINITY_DN7936_c0_g1_i6:174-518(+)